MQILSAIYAFLQCVLFILTWRFNAAKDEVDRKKALEVQADEAIRSGDIANCIAVWDAIRVYKH